MTYSINNNNNLYILGNLSLPNSYYYDDEGDISFTNIQQKYI